MSSPPTPIYVTLPFPSLMGILSITSKEKKYVKNYQSRCSKAKPGPAFWFGSLAHQRPPCAGGLQLPELTGNAQPDSDTDLHTAPLGYTNSASGKSSFPASIACGHW